MKIGKPPFWKKMGLFLSLGIIFQSNSYGQSNNHLSSHTYDTLITGVGYGTYQLSFPSWNPDEGLLVSVRVKAQVSVQYGFIIKNVDADSGAYSLSVGRENSISSTAFSTPFIHNTERKFGNYPLQAGESFSQAPFYFPDNYSNSDSITGTDNVAAFLGKGKVDFTYSPITYANIQTSNHANYYFSSKTQDTVHFSISYFYRKGEDVSGTSLGRFSAMLQGSPATPAVQLAWEVENDLSGRKYDVEVSRDGQHFTPVATLSSSQDKIAGYTYNYALAGDKTGKWHFRLKLTDVDGSPSYSGIKAVMVGAQAFGDNTDGLKLSLYPNPAADHINLSFSQGLAGAGGALITGGDWLIDLVSSNGNLIQRKVYRQAGMIRIDLPGTLPAGTYFIRATDLKEQKNYSAPFLIMNKN